MSTRRTEAIETLASPLYFIAVLLIATPVIDFATGVFPLRLDNIEWRFATVGLLSGFLLTPVLGIILAILVAALSGHDLVQRVIGFANIAIAVLFVALVVAFLLDIVQLRGVVQPESKGAFLSAAWKAVAKHTCFIVALAWLGVRGLRLAKSAAPAPARRQAAVVIG